MRWFALMVVPVVVAVAACSSRPAEVSCDGERLFGRPNQRTGLDDSQCGPACDCGGDGFVAPVYGDAEIAALLDRELAEPYPLLETDPYLAPPPASPAPDAVCAVRVVDASRYRLETFASMDAARDAGAVPTHAGGCGLCSPLADLAVYIRHPDLTDPVRRCGLTTVGQPAHLACLRELGFTEPCAQIWYFNTLHTRDQCLIECVTTLGAPYHLADGTLNACLVCDEVKSGPVFKAIAGRTRRNTGIASAMCRPCAEVVPLVHDYD